MSRSPASRHVALAAILGLILTSTAFSQTPPIEAGPNEKSPALVREVQAGQRAVANAAWWGFDEDDATESLQAAIRSGAKTVIVPMMGKDWIVARTIRLASNQELVFQPGVVVAAKKGKFLGGSDCLLAAGDGQNITLRGDGATLRMHKDDYSKPPFKKAEWRHALSLVGCSNVKLYGLTLRDSGGDGLYVGATGTHNYCKDIHVQNITCDNNHRQGISVISAENLLIENSRLLNTGGTAPECGIDLEPNAPDQRLVNCVIRNCVSEGNRGGGLFAYLNQLNSKSADLSIRFENCVVRNCGAGMGVGAIQDDGPGGFIEFNNVTVDGTKQCGISVYDKSAQAAVVRFVRCSVKNAAQQEGHPICLQLRRPQLTTRPGGIVLDDCVIVDSQDRPFLVGGDAKKNYSVSDIQGKVTVESPAGSRVELGPNPSNIDFKVTYTQPKPTQP